MPPLSWTIRGTNHISIQNSPRSTTQPLIFVQELIATMVLLREYICPLDTNPVRINDINSLLIQLPGQPGLEILTREHSWVPVPVIPGAILVNIGDLLSYWSNGLLKSTVHRVI